MIAIIGGPGKEEEKKPSAFPSKLKPKRMIGGPPDEEEATDEEAPEMGMDEKKDEALRIMGVPKEQRAQFGKALESFIAACESEEGE